MFAGWNTRSDDYGDTYSAGSLIAAGTVNVTLYASWSGQYSVTCDANGATGTAHVDSSTCVQGVSVTVPDNTGNMTSSTETFAGWNTKPTGLVRRIPRGSTLVMSR